jgi:hypothetical protein
MHFLLSFRAQDKALKYLKLNNKACFCAYSPKKRDAFGFVG